MIAIHIDSQHNAFIWNAQDWYELRSKHHIVGSLVGTLWSAAKNSKILALPCQLLPEEVTLLTEENICKLVQFKNTTENVVLREGKFNVYKEQVRQEQMEAYIREKEKKVHSMLDTIVQNKESSAKSKDIVERDQVLQEELAKIVSLSDEHILVERFLEDPWLEYEDLDSKYWTHPETKKDILKYSIFKDLWHKNYFITNGNKFGGDYLVYKGDPSKFHAEYIVICRCHTETFKAAELAMYGRVGSNAKKKVVIGSLNPNGQVMYQSLSWADLVT
ncbi:hypothetical protein M8J77_006752 [Diaphorina citri]|nr:hypothetical protein M8J77_006752 [Diaphorina citri]